MKRLWRGWLGNVSDNISAAFFDNQEMQGTWICGFRGSQLKASQLHQQVSLVLEARLLP